KPRVERAPQLVGAIHAYHGNFTGLVVDLDLCDQAGMRIAGGRRHFAGLGINVGQRHEKIPRPGFVLPCLNWAAMATSLVEIDRCGAPLLWTLPRPSVS